MAGLAAVVLASWLAAPLAIEDEVGPPGTLDDDLVAWPEGRGTVHEAAAPRVFYLWYADGGDAPTASVCRARPPEFVCGFGASVDECRRKVQAHLDRWYADFNIIFTFNQPTSGAYYTAVITSGGGQWCEGRDPSVAGLAPFNKDCSDFNGNTCYAFSCGRDAFSCAVVVAQEQAHLVGLEHTASANDVMSPSVCVACDGFERQDNPVDASRCRTTQNSYQMMLDRLGAWPGGTKPSPLDEPIHVRDGGPPALYVEGNGRGCAVSAGRTATPAALLLGLLPVALRRRRAQHDGA